MPDESKQAFPVPVPSEPGSPGMTLREWYAGQALQGLLAQGAPAAVADLARRSVEMADALLVALKEG